MSFCFLFTSLSGLDVLCYEIKIEPNAFVFFLTGSFVKMLFCCSDVKASVRDGASSDVG